MGKSLGYAIVSPRGDSVDYELYDDYGEAEAEKERYERERLYLAHLYPMEIVEVVPRKTRDEGGKA